MSEAPAERSATLLCWNVAGRVQKLPEQLGQVIAQNPDVICLQETAPSTVMAWQTGLADAGWVHSLSASPAAALTDGRSRPLITLTAARTALEAVPLEGLPWPERVLASKLGELQIVNVHSPTSPKPDLAKVLTHELVAGHLAGAAGPRLVCGDFNTPRKEHPDGRIWTFARDRYGRLREDRGERWDRAELALLKGLEDHGFRDAFRELHGPAVREISWAWQRWPGGYRLDHLVVSSQICVEAVSYLHAWREAGLSDHSPLYARLRW